MGVRDRIDRTAIDAWCAWDAVGQRGRPASSVVGGDDPEEGSTTVEYAIGAVATAGFAGLLLVVLKSGAVKGLLQGIIERALSL